MELNLQAIREDWNTETLLDAMIHRVFRNKVAVVSSFGTESAVLLHMVAQVDRAVPVIFLDTGKLFPETLAYRDMLVDRLELTDVRSIPPSAATLDAVDSDGKLWRSDPSLCCWARKVEPLDEALSGFEAWITGRKRFQGGKRSDLALVESGDDGRTKINPLAFFGQAELDAYFAQNTLPRHPLEAKGYRSIGCAVCTRPTRPGEDPRAGRWSGTNKTECGIHDRSAVVDARGAGI